MNIVEDGELLAQFAPLIEDIINSPQGQNLIVGLISWFSAHPVSGPLADAIQKAALPALNVPPADTSLE